MTQEQIYSEFDRLILESYFILFEMKERWQDPFLTTDSFLLEELNNEETTFDNSNLLAA